MTQTVRGLHAEPPRPTRLGVALLAALAGAVVLPVLGTVAWLLG